MSREREALRRGLGRSRLAAVAVLVIAAALGSAAVVAAFRAQTNAMEARERLWESLVSQARAERLSGEVGGRTKALKAIREAAAIRPTEELRDEAIAALALIDLQPIWSGPGFPEDALKVAFSPDLNFYAVDFGRRIEIFNAKTQERHARMYKRPNLRLAIPYQPEQLLFSPDEKLLAGMYWGGFSIVWEVETGRELWRKSIGANDPHICGLSFDDAAESLAVSMPSASVVRVYGARSGEILKDHSALGVHAIALSPDGERIAWCNDKLNVALLDSGEMLLEKPLPAKAMEVRWSPDGMRVVTGGYEGRVLITDVDNGLTLETEPVPSTLHGMDFHPDGRFLMATAWDGVMRFWDTHQGTLRLATRSVSGVGFDRGGRFATHRQLVDTGLSEFVSNDLHRGFTAPGGATNDGFSSVDISPDGRWILAHARGSGRRFVWERATGRIVADGPDGLRGSIFSADGRWLYGSTSSSATRWPISVDEGFTIGVAEDLAGGEFSLSPGPEGRKWLTSYSSAGRGMRMNLEVEKPFVETLLNKLPKDDSVAGFSISADGRWGAVSLWGGHTAELWDIAKNERVREFDVFGGSAAFLPGGEYLALGSQRGLAIWEIDDWKKRELFPSSGTASVACSIGFSTDGRYISYDPDRASVCVIDAGAMAVAANFSNPQPGRVYDQCLSDDGRFLLIASGYKLDLWELPAVEKELAGLGLCFGKQADAPKAAGIGNTGFSPFAAAVFAALILLVALGFGLYTIFYQRHLIHEFEAQFEIIERTQKELVHSEKMKALGTLSAGVAHDFKNLLSVIKLSNDLIRRDVGGREDIIEEVDAIGHAVNQGDQVVKAMLGYSRGSDAAICSVDVSGAIEGTIALLGQQFLSGVSLTLELDRDLPEAAIPHGALEQMLLNLVINASEAMGGMGALEITARCEDVKKDESLDESPVLQMSPAVRYVRVRLTDDGPGMDEETLPRIFEPFFTTKTIGAEKGTGLGLAMVYKIARDNGLGLAVSSQIRAGTRFEIRIPVMT